MDGLADGKDGEEIKITKEKKDPTYSLRWDCIRVILKVQNILFKIPRQLLLAHSQYFRDLHASPKSKEGATKENPIVVSDITVKEFRHFLQIILPLGIEDLEAVRTSENSGWKEEWISVLNISTLWRCVDLRRIAIRALESNSTSFGVFTSQSNPGTPLTGTEKIILGRKNFVSSWVEAGYVELLISGKISDKNMRKIGSEESFKLTRIMLGIKQNQTALSLNKKIKETFQAELRSIAIAEESFAPTE